MCRNFTLLSIYDDLQHFLGDCLYKTVFSQKKKTSGEVCFWSDCATTKMRKMLTISLLLISNHHYSCFVFGDTFLLTKIKEILYKYRSVNYYMMIHF